ncbi:putative NADH-dependent flavin oxidoreductase YqiG [Vibrio algivorus]|uniref:NADH-dependent flavin oxidoreductase YqiG n=1 Tax=Vibrio algivorus TaxID=1667024 RepID=A0ABQ6ELR6_9VIBR|nr:putative NADH-dependent flavin oxidoreductase YqiG [Vibrio algivorus]
MAPLTHNMSSETGDPSQAELDWLARCIRGGFGLVITAATQVLSGGRCWLGQPALVTPFQQNAFSTLAKTANENNALVLVQLHHGGLRAASDLNDGAAPVGPSEVQPGGRYDLGVTELKDKDIYELIEAFVRSAQRAYDAGLHGVELHAAHNFLLCNFLNPTLNKRTDQWGGSVKSRSRFLIEIIRGIRARLPRQFLVGVRLSPESYANIVGIKLDNQLAVTRLLANEEIDYVHFSMGDTFKSAKDKPNSDLLTELSKAVPEHIPLMVAGNIHDGIDAEIALEGGADLVAIGSAALGNPDWVKRINNSTPLVCPPYTKHWMIVQGFTSQGLDYLMSHPSLIEPVDVE